jgi:uncharacterized membrane protein
MRRARSLALVIGVLSLMLAPLGAMGQEQTETTQPPPDSLTLTTPYPGVVVEAGDQVSFALTVAAPEPTDVTLTAEGVPDGWTSAFRGGGFELDSVTAGPTAPEVSFDVTVPPDAAEETFEFTVVASGGGETVEVPLQVRVSAQAGGEVTLTPDFPGLRAPAGETVTFNVELNNGTPSDLQFELDSSAPAGWDVTAQPSAEAQASTIQVAAGSAETITVEATSPPQVEAGQYPITVQATSPEAEVSAEMIVEVVGSYALELSTPEQRLNAEVNAGGTSEIQLLLTNSGTAPLQGVQLSATPPSDWEVTFDTPVIEQIPAGESVVATASVTPSDQAVAGDYVITFNADSEEATGSVDIRTTVNPSAVWGFVGIGLIALTLAGLAFVFRRFGRR